MQSSSLTWHKHKGYRECRCTVNYYSPLIVYRSLTLLSVKLQRAGKHSQTNTCTQGSLERWWTETHKLIITRLLTSCTISARIWVAPIYGCKANAYIFNQKMIIFLPFSYNSNIAYSLSFHDVFSWNVDRDIFEILEAWMYTIKQQNKRSIARDYASDHPTKHSAEQSRTKSANHNPP